jgi:FkbM family methyltransferase
MKTNRPERFYGQWSPPLDEVIWDRYFADREAPGVCVECGAGDGVTESTCYAFEKHLGWKCINIEAFFGHFLELKQNRPGSINIHAALGGDQEDKTFRQAVHPLLGNRFGNGSVRHLEAHIEDLERQGCSFDEFVVPGATWRSVCAQAEITAVDLFVLDVEGYELEILKTLAPLSVLPDVFVIELWPENESDANHILSALGYSGDGGYQNNKFFRLRSR